MATTQLTNGDPDETNLRLNPRGVGSDGLPRLPPIAKSKLQDDPYVNSKLRKFRMAKHKQELLKKIMLQNALSVYEETTEYNSKQPPKEVEPEYPKEMMSKDRKIRLNYQFMKKCVESAPVPVMQEEWFENMLGLVPEKQKLQKGFHEFCQTLQEEVKEDFERSMKKSVVQQTLLKPEVGGLESDDNEVMQEDATGVDYSSPWHDSLVANREKISQNLHMLHPSMQTVLRMCKDTLGGMLLCDCSEFRSNGAQEFDSLRNNIILECERNEERLMSNWLPGVINVFADKNNFTSVKSNKLDSFYSSVTSLIAIQLRSFLMETIGAWVSLFDEANKQLLPILKMELIFDDDTMQFYPTFTDLQELVTFVIDQITSSLQNVPTVQSWLSGGANTVSAKVDEDFVNEATRKIREAVKRNFEEPEAHLQWFFEKYNWIVNGEAQKQITDYMDTEHGFEEYCTYIEKFRSLSKEIMGLPSIEHYDMIQLDCEDLKRGLSQAAKALADQLLTRVASDHRTENQRICEEFLNIKKKKVPTATLR